MKKKVSRIMLYETAQVYAAFRLFDCCLFDC